MNDLMPSSKLLNEEGMNGLRNMKALNAVFRMFHKVACESVFAPRGISYIVVEKNAVKSMEQCAVDDETKSDICSCFEKFGEVACHFQVAVEL
jgi:hypothetical protein